MNQPVSGNLEAVMMSGVSRKFDDARLTRTVLDDVDFAASAGNLTAITGPSGSGKSTFLHLKHIGLVFQFFNLLPTLNVIENLRLPLELCSLKSDDSAILPLLERLELQNQAYAYPDRLSGGEQQRIAVIRATIHKPSLILADEPTGNLDDRQGSTVLDLIRQVSEEGTCVIMATHSRSASEYADRHYTINNGKLVEASET